MRDRCLGDRCEDRSEMKQLTQNSQSVLKCFKLTLWLSRYKNLQLAKAFGCTSDSFISIPSVEIAGDLQIFV